MEGDSPVAAMFCSSSYIEFVSQANLIITPPLLHFTAALFCRALDYKLRRKIAALRPITVHKLTISSLVKKWNSERVKEWTWRVLWNSTLGEVVGVMIIGGIAFVCPSKCIFVSLHTSTFVYSYYYRCIIEGGIIAACVQSQAERISSPSTPQITSKAKLLYWMSKS